MKIILGKDVVGIGKRGDIKEVRDGFFRNFLLPNKLAVLATKEKMKEIERMAELKEKTRKISQGKSASEINKLSGRRIALDGKANEKGSLYKAIMPKDIVKKLAEEGFTEVQPEWIILEKPIKEAGKFELEIKSPSGKSAKAFIEIRGQR